MVNLLAGGVMGRPASQEHLGKVRLLFSNPDLLWSNEHPTGRFGQGAFRTALEALHSEVNSTSGLCFATSELNISLGRAV